MGDECQVRESLIKTDPTIAVTRISPGIGAETVIPSEGPRGAVCLCELPEPPGFPPSFHPLAVPAAAGHGQRTKLPDARNHYIGVKHPFLLPQPLFLLQHSVYNQGVYFNRYTSFHKKA